MLFDSSRDIVFYDGAMGTMLQMSGLAAGERPDMMNMSSPDAVERVHRLYVEAGSDIICTNTFGANSNALSGTGYTPEDIITTAVGLAKRASGGAAKVALDIGPIGMLMEPMGDLEFNRAYDLFSMQAVAGERAGADLAAIETMSDIKEIEAAILAVTENTTLPVLATMTFNKNGRTFIGSSVEDFAETAQRYCVAAAGINCSLEPMEMFDTVERIANSISLPLIIKPNAGLPDKVTGLYNIGPAEFARQMTQFIRFGAQPEQSADRSRRLMIVGGCCGTTPDHIRALRKAFAV